MTVDNPPEDIRSNPGISDDQASRDAQESLRLLGYHDLANLIDEPGDNGGADHDVLIVGAGQTGVTAAFGLRRRGVRRAGARLGRKLDNIHRDNPRETNQAAPEAGLPHWRKGLLCEIGPLEASSTP